MLSVCSNRAGVRTAQETARADRPLVGVDSGDVEPGNRAECFGDARRTHSPDIFLGDDEYRRGGVGNGLELLGNRADLDCAQIAKTPLVEPLLPLTRRGTDGKGESADREGREGGSHEDGAACKFWSGTLSARSVPTREIGRSLTFWGFFRRCAWKSPIAPRARIQFY